MTEPRFEVRKKKKLEDSVWEVLEHRNADRWLDVVTEENGATRVHKLVNIGKISKDPWLSGSS